MPAGEFFEIFVDTPLEICERRDPKGLYARARAGKIRNFTGIGSPYEPPSHPDLMLYTERETVEECVERLVAYLKARQVLSS